MGSPPLALFAGAFVLGRKEALVGNEQFLESDDSSHRSRAVLVCQEADNTDPEITRLYDTVDTQREEIAQVQAVLRRC